MTRNRNNRFLPYKSVKIENSGEVNRMLKMMTDLELFVTTVEEYKRFSSFLKFNENVSLVDGYSEEDYIGIQVRLMLLRKYYGGKKENVSLHE